MALKSVALSLVNWRLTISTPAPLRRTPLTNSSASPWPKAVRSSITATRFIISVLTA